MRSFIRLRLIQDDTECQILRGACPACPVRTHGELAEGLRMTLGSFRMDTSYPLFGKVLTVHRWSSYPSADFDELSRFFEAPCFR